MYRASYLIIPLMFSGLSHGAEITVKYGDTLSAIAARELGNGRRWTEICELNKPLIENCDSLLVGTVLAVPNTEASVTSEKDGPSLSEVIPAAIASGGANLISENSDVNGEYWKGYWLKPITTAGKGDPDGGNNATRLVTADRAEDPGANASGIWHAEVVAPGTYELSVWLRSTSGSMNFNVGISDDFKPGRPFTVGETWTEVRFIQEVSKPTDRLFQVYETAKENPDWEIYNPRVVRTR